MGDYSLNCEGFTVRMGDVARPQVSRGLRVKKVNWSDGEFVPYEDRYYLDFEAYPGYQENMLTDERKSLSIALDETNRPKMRHRQVQEFSTTADLLRDPVYKGDFDVPIRLSKVVERPIGRAALISIIDFSPQSFRMGSASMIDKGNSIILAETRTVSNEANAGVTAVLMPEDTLIVVKQEYKSGSPDTDFSLRYLPRSNSGIFVEPLLRGGPERRSSEEGDDPGDLGGGSDREPKHPLVPHISGASEAEIPDDNTFETFPAIEAK